MRDADNTAQQSRTVLHCPLLQCILTFFHMQDVYEPVMQRIIPYMFCIGLIGIFMLVVMRKKFIIDYRLHFPSGTATGILIAGFHTPKGEAQAREQVGSRAAILRSYDPSILVKALRAKC